MPRYSVGLRIALFQLNPQIGQIDKTLSRSWSLINKFKSKLDPSRYPQLIVFPEFALTGYSFHSKDDIKPYIKSTKESPSFKFAQQVSRLFNCYTVIGYPEKSTNHPENWYNSALVTDPEGTLHFNYRKSFLYDTEYEWDCKENPKGFQQFQMTFPKSATNIASLPQDEQEKEDITLKASIGICMDLNPYKFEAPFNLFEFASYNLDNHTDLIICPMAWLHSQSVTKFDTESEEIEGKLLKTRDMLKQQSQPLTGSQGEYQFNLDNEKTTPIVAKDDKNINKSYTELHLPDMSNVNYWLLRFLPFLNLEIRKSWYHQLFSDGIMPNDNNIETTMGMSPKKYWEFKDQNSILLLCNRSGVEDNEKTIFAGSSGIVKFNGKTERHDGVAEINMDSLNESVELYGNLGKGAEGVILRDIQFEVER